METITHAIVGYSIKNTNMCVYLIKVRNKIKNYFFNIFVFVMLFYYYFFFCSSVLNSVFSLDVFVFTVFLYFLKYIFHFLISFFLYADF